MHLAATFDAPTGTITFYANGVKQTSTTASGLRTFDGAGGFSVGSGWTGDIDDARVYSGVLSDADVELLRRATSHF